MHAYIHICTHAYKYTHTHIYIYIYIYIFLILFAWKWYIITYCYPYFINFSKGKKLKETLTVVSPPADAKRQISPPKWWKSTAKTGVGSPHSLKCHLISGVNALILKRKLAVCTKYYIIHCSVLTCTCKYECVWIEQMIKIELILKIIRNRNK